MQHVNVGQGVVLYNNSIDVDWSERNINYAYYISATQKIIDEIARYQQLTLF